MQVVRYSALLGGIAYGFLHNRTVQKDQHDAAVGASAFPVVSLLTLSLPVR